MNVRVGTCSLCGGDVMGFQGAWMSVTPPPAPTCSQCGAVAAADVIPMVRAPRRAVGTATTTEMRVNDDRVFLSETNGILDPATPEIGDPVGLETKHTPNTYQRVSGTPTQNWNRLK